MFEAMSVGKNYLELQIFCFSSAFPGWHWKFEMFERLYNMLWYEFKFIPGFLGWKFKINAQDQWTFLLLKEAWFNAN